MSSRFPIGRRDPSQTIERGLKHRIAIAAERLRRRTDMHIGHDAHAIQCRTVGLEIKPAR
jgi:hypothetical protein